MKTNVINYIMKHNVIIRKSIKGTFRCEYTKLSDNNNKVIDVIHQRRVVNNILKDDIYHII